MTSNAYEPLGRSERHLLAVAAGAACISLLTATLWLFDHASPRPDWAGLMATPAGVDPSCRARDPRDAACQRRVAAVPPPAPEASAQPRG